VVRKIIEDEISALHVHDLCPASFPISTAVRRFAAKDIDRARAVTIIQ
jgi:hypothetical protein